MRPDPRDTGAYFFSSLRTLANGPRLPRGSFGLVVPLPLRIIILFPAWVFLADPDGTPELLVLIAFLEGAPAPLTILLDTLVTVAHVPLSPLIVQLIALQSLLAALITLLPALHGAPSILLGLLRLTALRVATLVSTSIALLTNLTLAHGSLLSMVSGIEKLGFELSTVGLRMLPTQRACRDRGQVEIGKGSGGQREFPHRPRACPCSDSPQPETLTGKDRIAQGGATHGIGGHGSCSSQA
jgi:hypothetical protein